MFRPFASFLSFTSLVVASLLGAAGPAAADDDGPPKVPQHSKICVDGLVSKYPLSKQILANTDASDIVDLEEGRWRTFFTDEGFCAKVTKGDDVEKCAAARVVAITKARNFFLSFNNEFKKTDGAYIDKGGLERQANGDTLKELRLFFKDSSNTKFQIGCSTKQDVRPPAVAFNPDKDPIAKNLRLRGASDDVNIPHSIRDYKGTTPASLTFQGDTSATHTSSAKFNGALGYGFSVGSGQIVPYISANQSVSDTALKPRTIDLNDNVAAGVVFEQRFANDWISNAFSIKPQYLFNTATNAELLSARGIYTPHVTDLGLNSFVHFAGPDLPWGEILFNVRSDSGNYLDRGNMPVPFIANQNFERAGGQIGFALTTDAMPAWPSMSLVVTETYVHGFSGFYRAISQQQANFTYNVANSFLGLTATYKHGRDEDTAVNAQSWQVGLSAHY